MKKVITICKVIIIFLLLHILGDSMFDRAEIVASLKARWSLNPSYMHTFG